MKWSKNTTQRLFITLSLVMLGFAIQGCSSERKLAMSYADNTGSVKIMVLQPENIFKINQKIFLLDSLGSIEDNQKDDFLLNHSLYLQHLNDSLFIANYMLGYTKELTKFGFHVYTEKQMQEFMNADSNAIQISIAQIELEETIYTFRDEAQTFGQTYYHDHDLNAVYVNSWFEFTFLNNHNQKPPIYFATDMLVDQVNGVFDYDQFAGQMRYMYNTDTISTTMLYDFAYDLGRVYAGFTFDRLLNSELDLKLPLDKRSDRYWRYDPYSQTFFLGDDDKFITLDE